MSSIIDRMAEAILKSGKPITMISKKSGLSRPMLYKILKREVSTISNDTIEAICKAIGILPYTLYEKSNESKKGVKIPVLGTVPAGVPIEAIEEILDYEEITPELARTGEFFGLKVRGDSMAPVIMENDVLIVKKQDDANTGDVCVVMVNGDDATVKKLKKNNNGIALIPNNPAYEPMYYSNKEINSLPVHIIGKVIESRRSF